MREQTDLLSLDPRRAKLAAGEGFCHRMDVPYVTTDLASGRAVTPERRSNARRRMPHPLPRVEAMIRDQLNSLNFDTTEFRNVGDGDATRTDDLTFGALLRKTGPGGRTVETGSGDELVALRSGSNELPGRNEAPDVS
ncbi:MAG TPA: hypothetical protein VIK25_01145 [Gemmatimonadaceae bacterium]